MAFNIANGKNFTVVIVEKEEHNMHFDKKFYA